MNIDRVAVKQRAKNLVRTAKPSMLNSRLNELGEKPDCPYLQAGVGDGTYLLSKPKDAFELMQAKYENGKATITEFNEAKNNYLKSESDLVQARYENLYQHALLEFYRGHDLNF